MRDFDPTSGRYIQADPLGLVPGPSLYGYARQSPMMYIDPNGLNPVVVWGIRVIQYVFGGGSAVTATGGRTAVISGAGTGGGAVGLGAAGATGTLGILSLSGDTPKAEAPTVNPEEDRTFPPPPPPKRGWRCTCRADANQNTVGSCATHALGTAEGLIYGKTKKAAKRIAIHKLGQQPKHVGCKCIDRNGVVRAP